MKGRLGSRNIYVKSWFGARRVVTGINIKANDASIFQALRKCPIVTADMFLFNIGKSGDHPRDVDHPRDGDHPRDVGRLRDFLGGSQF